MTWWQITIKPSELVKAALLAKRPTHWVLAIILTVFVGLMGMGALGQVLYNSVFGTPIEGSIAAQFSEFFTFGAIVLFVYVWITLKERRSFASVGILGKKGLVKFLMGYGVGVLMMIIPSLFLFLTGQYAIVERTGSTLGVSALGIVSMLFIVWVVQSSTEEVVMRGYLLQTTGSQLPAWPALMIPAVLFAVVHLTFEPLVILNIILVAIFFSFVSLRQGSIWIASGIHTGWNMTQGSFLGIPVSGHAPAVSLLALSPVDGSPAWLTGGAFGIEASVVATIVLAVAAVVGFVYFKQPLLTSHQ